MCFELPAIDANLEIKKEERKVVEIEVFVLLLPRLVRLTTVNI